MSGGGPARSRAKHSARSSRAIGIQNRLVRWPVDVPRAVYIRTLVQAFAAWPSNAVRGTLTDRRTEHDGWIRPLEVQRHRLSPAALDRRYLAWYEVRLFKMAHRLQQLALPSPRTWGGRR